MVQDYLEKKRIEKNPSIFIFREDKQGVSDIKEFKIKEIIKGTSIRTTYDKDGKQSPKVNVDTYKLDTKEYPFEVNIEEGGIGGEYVLEFGGAYHYSLSKSDLNKKRVKIKKNITPNYLGMNRRKVLSIIPRGKKGGISTILQDRILKITPKNKKTYIEKLRQTFDNKIKTVPKDHYFVKLLREDFLNKVDNLDESYDDIKTYLKNYIQAKIKEL